MVFSITHTIGKQSKTRMPRGLKVSCLLIVNMMEFINIILWRVTQTTSIPSVVVSIVFTTKPLCRWFCILTRPWAWWCAQTFGTIVEMLKHAQDDSFSMMVLAKKYGTTTTHYTSIWIYTTLCCKAWMWSGVGWVLHRRWYLASCTLLANSLKIDA